MLVDYLIEDLSKIEDQKRDLHDSLYTALQCEDVVKSRMFYQLIKDLEVTEKMTQIRINMLSELN